MQEIDHVQSEGRPHDTAPDDMVAGQGASVTSQPIAISAKDGDAEVLIRVVNQEVEAAEVDASDLEQESSRMQRFFDRVVDGLVKNSEAIGENIERVRGNVSNPVLRAPLDLLHYVTGSATRLGGFGYMGYDISQGIAGRIAPSLNKEEKNNLKDFASVFGVASSAAFMMEDSYRERPVDDIIGELNANLDKVGLVGLSIVAEERRAAMPVQEKAQKFVSDQASKLGSAIQIISSSFMFLYGAKEKKVGERSGAILNIIGFGAKLFPEAESMPEREWYDPRRVVDFIRYRPSSITGITGNAASLGSISAGLEDFARGVKKGEADERFTEEERQQFRKAGYVQMVGQVSNTIADISMGMVKTDFVGLNNNTEFFQKAAESMVRHIDSAQGETLDEKLRFAAHQVAEQLSFEMSLAPKKIENKLLNMVQVEREGVSEVASSGVSA